MEPVYRGIEIAAAVTARALGTAITYQGLENIPATGGAVIAMNHISYIDYLPAGLASRQRRRRIRYMLKAEALEHGAVDWVIRHTDCIPVDRAAGAGAYAEAVRRLRAGQLIGVFPEATISRSFELKEFKTGAVRMALEAQVPEVAEWNQKSGLNALKLLDRRLGESPFLAAERLTIADIVAAVGIDFARIVRLRPPEEMTHLHRWLDAMRERPGAKA